MNTEQWFLFSVITLLLFNGASRSGAFILFVAYCFYEKNIVDLSATYYYSGSSLLNLIVGLTLFHERKAAAICSYFLVILNVFGYLLWYGYYPPAIYDNIALIILSMQLVFILPKGMVNGLRSDIKYIVAKSAIFNRIKTSVTMYKINSFKKTKK